MRCRQGAHETASAGRDLAPVFCWHPIETRQRSSHSLSPALIAGPFCGDSSRQFSDVDHSADPVPAGVQAATGNASSLTQAATSNAAPLTACGFQYLARESHVLFIQFFLETAFQRVCTLSTFSPPIQLCSFRAARDTEGHGYASMSGSATARHGG